MIPPTCAARWITASGFDVASIASACPWLQQVVVLAPDADDLGLQFALEHGHDVPAEEAGRAGHQNGFKAWP